MCFGADAVNATSLSSVSGHAIVSPSWEDLALTAELAVLAISIERRILYASPFLCELTGVVRPNLVGCDAFEWLFPPEYHDRARAHFSIGIEAHPSSAVIPVLTRSGGHIEMRWTRAVTQETLDGEMIMVATGVRAGDSMRHDALIISESDNLAGPERTMPAGFWEYDLKNHEVRWSSQVYRILGVDPAVATPSFGAFLEMVHPDDRAQVDAAFHRSRATLEPGCIAHRLTLANGRTIWVEHQFDTAFAASGAARTLHGVIQDTTSTILAEQTARRNELMISSFLHVSPEAVLVTSASGVIRTFSEGAERIFHCRREAVIGKSIDILMPERFHATHQVHLAAFTRSRKSAMQMGERSEILARRLTGAEFAAEASVSKMSTGEGELFVVILRDLSERKAYEAALLSAKARAEAAAEAKSLFLATMSHEIRTPMNGVLGMLSVLATEQLRPAQKEMVQAALEAGTYLMEILNDILDYSRIEAGGLEIEIVKFDPRAVLRKVQRLHGVKAEAAGVTLELIVDASVPQTLIGDPARVQQIMHNLVGNAVKFTPAGRVSVRARYEENDRDVGLLRLDVEDSGIGMSTAQRAIIFERFAQADSSITRRFGGTGLGLSIVKGLVDAMSGVIAVQSELGSGSHFTVKLPLQAYAEPPTGMERTAAIGPSNVSQRELRALVVEGGGLHADAIRTLLNRVGVAVIAVRDGKEALGLYQPGRFDLVFLGAHMPVCDCEAALKVIRSLEHAAGARHALVFVCAELDGAEHYRNLGFDSVLVPPVDMEELRRLMSVAQARIDGTIAGADAAG